MLNSVQGLLLSLFFRPHLFRLLVRLKARSVSAASALGVGVLCSSLHFLLFCRLFVLFSFLC
jgi:hypothetical protein